ncbi:MAG TPA: membrane protein insertase YidC [Candidatus Binataceae bacterium]|nr:membrane protein insertase YidC [Candidatus Binataceae bacterium]
MDTRILIAIILSLAVVFAYQELVLDRLYPPQPPHAPASSVPTPAQRPALPLVAAPQLGSGQPLPLGSQATAAAHTIRVETEDYIARFTTAGGRLESLQLKHFHQTAAPHSPLLQLVTPAPDGELPLGLVVEEGARQLDDRDVVYQTNSPASLKLHSGQSATLDLTASTADGLKLEKRLTFTAAGYVFDLNASAAGGSNTISAAGVAMSLPLGKGTNYFDIPEIQALVNGSAKVEPQKALAKGVAPLSGQITYAGIGQLYFLSVFLPQMQAPGTLTMAVRHDQATAIILYPAQAGRVDLATRVYMGPKELTTLEAVNPELRRAINFGWAGLLALAFLRALKLFHHITPNYGVDIILLTVAIRLLFLPLSIKSQRSMMRLQRLQPQVERLREKLKDDKERLNREMMDLYKRNHVNPLGGCAPMLLQLPIFLGLYEALANSIELRHAPFIAWVRDLSAPECLVIPGMPQLPFMPCGGLPILVLLMGASTWLQQALAPKAADPNQQKMMMLMPLMFTVMFLNLPAGLSLYYFSSNVLGIIQQYFLNREFKQLGPANA